MDTAAVQKELEALAERALGHARKAGAGAARVSAAASTDRKVMVRDGKVEEIKSASSRKLVMHLYVDGRYGTHVTSVLDDASMRTFIGSAVEMTRILSPDPHRQLVGPSLQKGRSKADLGLYDAGHGRVPMDALRARANAAHDSARKAAGAKLLSAGGGASDRVSIGVMRTTNGFADGDKRTSSSTWASVSVRDKGDKRPSESAHDQSRTLAGLRAPAELGVEAAERTLATLGADKIATLTLPIIVENRVVGRLMRGLLAPLSGWALDQKRSCFEHSLGKAIGSDRLVVADDPLLRGGWASQRFDGEGITAKRRTLFEKGVLRAFFIDSYQGRKLGREPTSGRASNLVFGLGTESLDAMLARVGRAVLITGILGGNSNSTTGDFSHGVRGFLIEGGKRTRPLAAMNIAGNHTTFWKGLQALGNDPWPYATIRSPSLLFAPTLVAGK